MSGRRIPLVKLALWALALVACSTSPTSVRAVPTTASTLAPATTTAPSVPTTAAPTTAAATPADGTSPPASDGTGSPTVATVSTLVAGDLGRSWHDGCPLGPDQLRLLRLDYWGFDDRPHQGSVIVNASVTDEAIEVFRRLFDEHFPIRRMEPVDVFGGDDNASMASDNTSGFNCRAAVAPGPPQWSAHAYGQAIDVNPVENPYLQGGDVLPPAGDGYLDRADVRPGMAVAGSPLTAAFAASGWSWGGEWSTPDYQHFSATGG